MQKLVDNRVEGESLVQLTLRRNTMKHIINRPLPAFEYLKEVGEDSA